MSTTQNTICQRLNTGCQRLNMSKTQKVQVLICQIKDSICQILDISKSQYAKYSAYQRLNMSKPQYINKDSMRKGHNMSQSILSWSSTTQTVGGRES